MTFAFNIDVDGDINGEAMSIRRLIGHGNRVTLELVPGNIKSADGDHLPTLGLRIWGKNWRGEVLAYFDQGTLGL